MTEAGNANAGGATKGCGCASTTTAAAPAETAKPGCCGGGNDHTGHGHGDHHSDGKATGVPYHQFRPTGIDRNSC